MILANNITHYIGGQDFGEPRNWNDLEITIDWLNKKEGVNINITDLEFVKKANKFLQERVMNGLNGGVGIFEGEAYSIKVGDPVNPIYTFKGYLDFTEDMTVVGAEQITASLKKQKGNDWLNDIADSFSMAYLESIGTITDSDYIKVPYVINYVPDGTQLVILSMSLYMMTKELIENVQKIAEAIADVTDAATPVIGVGVGFGAVAVTAWDLGNFIMVSLKLLARIAYTIAIIIAIKELISQIFSQLLPKKRYHLGMTFEKMFQVCCSHLGMTLSSSLLSSKRTWVHVPPKDKKGGSNGEKGFPTNTSAIYTFGDLIRVAKEMFNADFKIYNGIFYFERVDYFKTQGNYILPNTFNNPEKLLDNVKFNTDEMIANYNIYYQYDTQDQNTMDDQSGRVFQSITTPMTVHNKDFVNIKGLSEISIPFSLGKCKTEFTAVEKLAKDLGKFVDKLTGIFGGGTNFASQIEGRIGSMLMSSDFLSYGRVVVMSGSELAKNQSTLCGALVLWEQHHIINTFAEIDGIHNQWYRYLGKEVPMNIQDFALLLENNYGKTLSGEPFMIEKMVYKPNLRKAVVDYRINKKYTNNLKVIYV